PEWAASLRAVSVSNPFLQPRAALVLHRCAHLLRCQVAAMFPAQFHHQRDKALQIASRAKPIEKLIVFEDELPEALHCIVHRHFLWSSPTGGNIVMYCTMRGCVRHLDCSHAAAPGARSPG